tara:strand:+ start:342 stop:518 length:177 start_codon:yes stop_codon:yes gene_type:complete
MIRHQEVLEFMLKASQSILEKEVFKKEGVLQKATYKNDQFLDLHIYAILRENWIANNR